MSDTVIRVENLGKKYIIDHQQEGRSYKALRDVIADGAKSLLSPFQNSKSNIQNLKYEEFWALKDVSFEIKQGDRVGIIGRNGAGKSTLLKLLSRITEPSKGRIQLEGRVASLLEVGTGFHPELTGRENIYLNGAILGMSRVDIKRKFDEIVAFAEVERFLDTPVKRYSSGVYVRLAFAVAAHLEPEILIIDEVLAVGDAAFQEKCLGKMETLNGSGKTLLFVSHNMNAVERLCDRCLLLERGNLKTFDSDVRQVIKLYNFDESSSALPREWIKPSESRKYENPWFLPTQFVLTDNLGNHLDVTTRNDAEIWVQIEGNIQEIDSALTIGYAIYSEEGQLLYWSYHTDSRASEWPILQNGSCTLRSKIPSRLLNEGKYRLELIGGLNHRTWLFQPGVNAPSIYLDIRGGLSDSPYWMAKRPGLIAPQLAWERIERAERA